MQRFTTCFGYETNSAQVPRRQIAAAMLAAGAAQTRYFNMDLPMFVIGRTGTPIRGRPL